MVFTLILSAFFSSSCGAEEKIGTFDNGLSYSLVNNEITITGYSGESAVINIASSYIVDGVPRKVTKIFESAFYECEELTSVVIPYSVKEIGDYAFDECQSLKSVTVFGRDVSIGEYAFGFYWVKHKPVPVDGFLLKGYNGSTSQKYCSDNGIKFEQIVELGDYNGDGVTNIIDLVKMKKAFVNSEETDITLDFNGDGNTGAKDLIVFVNYLLKKDTGINTFKVNFKDKNGKVIKSDVVMENFSAVAPEPPEIPGFEFQKWNKEYNDITAEIDIEPIYTEIIVTNPTILVEDSVVDYGKNTVDVTVKLLNNPGIASMTFDVTYDSTNLVLQNVSFDSSFGDYVTAAEPYGSPQTISLISPYKDIEQDGDFATLTFGISENVKTGTEFDISIVPDASNIFNTIFEDVTFDVSNGKIIIK